MCCYLWTEYGCDREEHVGFFESLNTNRLCFVFLIVYLCPFMYYIILQPLYQNYFVYGIHVVKLSCIIISIHPAVNNLLDNVHVYQSFNSCVDLCKSICRSGCWKAVKIFSIYVIKQINFQYHNTMRDVR